MCQILNIWSRTRTDLNFSKMIGYRIRKCSYRLPPRDFVWKQVSPLPYWIVGRGRDLFHPKFSFIYFHASYLGGKKESTPF